jgi:hypothetical protein
MHHGLGRRPIEQGPMAASAAPTESVSSPAASPCSEIGHCEGERLFGTAAEIKPGLGPRHEVKVQFVAALVRPGRAGP